MSSPKADLPAHGQPIKREHVEALLKFLQGHPLLNNYSVVDVVHNGTDLNINVNHGLGRAYVGAIQIGASESDPVVVCLMPETARSVGADITKQAVFRQPTTDAMTTRWMVF